MFPKFFILLLSFTASSILCEDGTAEKKLREKFYAQLAIVNGDPATVGQIPYFVSIKVPARRFDINKTLWKNLCGGSIIGINKVLTAAHCFEVYDYQYLKNPSLLRVVAGSIRNSIIHSGTNVTDTDNQWRSIHKIVLHEHFSFPNNDIALIYVTNWVYSDYISYVIPASVTLDYDKRCLAVGFGMIGQGLTEGSSPVLLVAKIDVMQRWRCTIMWNQNMDSFVCSDSLLTDVARGDSGGPLVCKGTTDPVEEPGRDLLVGVVSGKSFDKSTLYTRVSMHKDWIERGCSPKFNPTFRDFYLCLITCLSLYAVYDI